MVGSQQTVAFLLVTADPAQQNGEGKILRVHNTVRKQPRCNGRSKCSVRLFESKCIEVYLVQQLLSRYCRSDRGSVRPGAAPSFRESSF